MSENVVLFAFFFTVSLQSLRPSTYMYMCLRQRHQKKGLIIVIRKCKNMWKNLRAFFLLLMAFLSSIYCSKLNRQTKEKWTAEWTKKMMMTASVDIKVSARTILPAACERRLKMEQSSKEPKKEKSQDIEFKIKSSACYRLSSIASNHYLWSGTKFNDC